MSNSKEESVQFQSYIDLVKHGKIPWSTFVTLMKDLCQTLPTAKDLNSVLINELKNFLEPNHTKPNAILENSKAEIQASEKQNDDFAYESDVKPKLEKITEPKTMPNSIIENSNAKTQNSEIIDKHSDVKEISKTSKIKKNKSNHGKYQCNHCEKSFPSKNFLNKHLPIHAEKTLECPHCFKKFNHKGRHRTHIDSVHLKLKPFKCEHCREQFSAMNVLRRHIRNIHFKIKPYQCEQCDKGYQDSFQLKKHVASIHNKDKCYDIRKEFDNEMDLQEDVKVNQELSVFFECDKCQSEFETEEHLKNHIFKVHGI